MSTMPDDEFDETDLSEEELLAMFDEGEPAELMCRRGLTEPVGSFKVTAFVQPALSQRRAGLQVQKSPSTQSVRTPQPA